MRMSKVQFLILAVAVFSVSLMVASTTATADIFHLKSGGKVEGKLVSQDATSYTVQTKFGSQTLQKSDVDRVEEKAFSGGDASAKKAEYKERLGKTDPRDANAHYELGMWAKNNKLTKEANKSFRKAIQLDQNHEGANKALGRVQYEGLWVSPGEAKRLNAEKANEEYRAKGLVQYKGEWVKKSDIEHIEAGKVKYEDKDAGTTQWVTKDELKKLENGLVQYDGRWMSKDEADNLAKGLFKVEGEYVSKEKANEYHSSWDNAWEIDSEHYMLITNKDYDYAIDAIKKAEKTYAELAKFFNDEPQLYGDKLYIYMFKNRDEYNQFGKDNTGQEEGHRQSVFGGFYAAGHPDTPAAINSEYDESTKFDWTEPNLYHTLTLQYIAEVQPNITSAWLRESIVSYFQRFAFYQWPSLREDWGKFIIGNRFIPLDEFMELTSLDSDPSLGFYVGGDRPRHVAQGGLLILFLTKGGPVEYQEKFAEFLEKMKKSSLDTETFRKIMKPKQLEKDFQAWIEGLQ